MAPKGNWKASKEHSGIAGLIQRDTGVWCVRVAFTREEQLAWRQIHKKSKTYLQRSLKTKDLGLAKTFYPEVYSAIREELTRVMVASGNIDRLPPVDRMKYGVGRRYEEMVNVMAAPPSADAAVLMDQIGGLLSRLTELEPSKASVIEQQLNQVVANAIATELQDGAVNVVDEQGLAATPENLSIAETSLQFAYQTAIEQVEAKGRRGVFAVESEGHKQLVEAASMDGMKGGLRIWDLLDAYLQVKPGIGVNVIKARKRKSQQWIDFIGSDLVDAITSANVVTYHRHLAKEMQENIRQGKTGPSDLSTVKGVNDKCTHLKMLVGTWNKIHAGQPDEQLPSVEFMLLEESSATKKERKLKQRTKATTEEAKLALMRVATEEAADPFRLGSRADIAGQRHGAWKALLLMDNTTLRRIEVAWLQWKHVIKYQGIWVLDVTVSKTEAGIRYIPLNSVLCRILLPLKEKVNDPEAWIVDNGGQVNQSPQQKISDFCCRRAKVLGLGDKVNPHSWRHKAGGELGVSAPEGVKRALMGHAGGVTQKYWSDCMESLVEFVENLGTRDEQLLKAMDALVESAEPGPTQFAKVQPALTEEERKARILAEVEEAVAG